MRPGCRGTAREGAAGVERADAVVVGGGVNGLSTAYQLAAQGAGRVILVERRHLAAGASGKSGALVRTHYTNEPETRLAYESLKVFAHWDDAIGGDCGFRPVGLLVLVPPRLRGQLEANVAMHRRVGVESRLVTTDDVCEIEPGMWCGDTDAIAYEPDSGYADPNLTAYGFARAGERAGVEYRLDTAVTAVRTRGGRVAGVATSHGDIEAPVVVVAAGAWADALFEPLGIRLGLRPVQARVVLFRPAYEQPPARSTCIDHLYGRGSGPTARAPWSAPRSAPNATSSPAPRRSTSARTTSPFASARWSSATRRCVTARRAATGPA